MSTVDDDGHSVIGIDPENSDSSDNSDSLSTEDVADKGEVQFVVEIKNKFNLELR